MGGGGGGSESAPLRQRGTRMLEEECSRVTAWAQAGTRGPEAREAAAETAAAPPPAATAPGRLLPGAGPGGRELGETRLG